MSTEIKNTLFRFVSLRSPELPETEERSLKFVFRAKEVTGYFDAAIEGKPDNETCWAAMLRVSNSFTEESYFYTDVEEVYRQSGFGEDGTFPLWLIRNRKTVTAQEVRDKINTLNAKPATNRVALWDNLFYQVVTQQSFAIKEAIMHTLLASHVISHIADTSAKEALLFFATTVLPKKLFVEYEQTGVDALTSKTTGEASVPVISKNLINKMDAQNAKINIKNLEQLKAELLIIEKRYNKEYKEAYDLAYKEYLERIQPELDAYNVTYEKALAEWCKNRDPEIEEGDPCYNKPTYNPPHFTFDFSYPPFLEKERLDNFLTPKSLSLLRVVLGIEKAQSQEDRLLMTYEDYESMAEVTVLIDEQINRNQQRVAQNATTVQVQFIGGVAVPSAGNVLYSGDSFSFYLAVGLNELNLSQISLSFSVPDETWQLIGGVYFFEGSGTTNTNGYNENKTSRDGNTLILSEMFGGAISYGLLMKGERIFGELNFSNGCTKSFSVSLEGQLPRIYAGVLSGECEGGDASGDDIEMPPAFKPSGFGFRQLGIADYRKVDQSVFCYTAGEVAHIENIMAREYREKSTRRFRSTEDTTTSSSETEREQLTDTTTTSRFEMQSEVSNLLQESKDLNAFVNTSYNYGNTFSLDAGASFASHTSKEESIQQAQTEAKEITDRAMDRLVSKVREERIYKVVEEYEENNKHGFDNRKGDKHVVGVYRWVDKIYKNQIYNYGKRLMFEFMIPQPGKLHQLGMTLSDYEETMTIPQDPRTATDMRIASIENLTSDKAIYWASVYNVEIAPYPSATKKISSSFGVEISGGRKDDGEVQIVSGKGELTLPEGYVAYAADFAYNVFYYGYGGRHRASVTIGGIAYSPSSEGVAHRGTVVNFLAEEKLGYSFSTGESPIMSGSITAHCRVKSEWIRQWKIETFHTIITAYEEALEAFEEKAGEMEALAGEIKDDNPAFYRDIENIILRKNCISYLVDRENDFGKRLYRPENGAANFENYDITLSSTLDNYTAKAKFMEQAFEWNIMSYSLYPYYWGAKTDWRTMYQYDNVDPTFRNFIAAGLARVVVTVRPGFEDAVRHFMATGQIWNGGQVPVIEDDLYLSIVEELKEEPGKAEGKAWLNRLPTSLTILQAESIGLKVEKALPCHCEELLVDNPQDYFVNPEMVSCDAQSPFEITQNQMEHGDSSTDVSNFGDQPPFTAVYNEVDNDDNDHEYKFKVLNQAGETLIFGTKKYDTEALAVQALNYCLQQIVNNHATVIEHTMATDQRWHYRVYDIHRTQLARSVNKYASREASEAAAGLLVEWAEKITA